MKFLPFIFASFSVWHLRTSATLASSGHNDPPLVQSSSFLGPQAAKAGRFLRHPRMARQLMQQQEDECPDFVNNIGVYQQTVLGPANASDSLFQNVKLPSNESLPLDYLTYLTIFPLYVDQSEPTFVQEDQYFGRNGEVTNVLLQQHELLTAFWNMTAGPPVLLMGVHSESLKDLLPESVQAYYNLCECGDPELLTDEALNEIVDEASTAIEEEVPSNYSNPGLTLVADYWHHPRVAGFEDSVALGLGDGLLDWSEWSGLSKEFGGSCFHAYLFSWAVQFALDLEDRNGNLTEYEENPPEDYRRRELEAMAMAGYSLAHDQGGNWSADMLVQASHVAYWNGDCYVEEMYHSGTPSQNECAVLWGAGKGLQLAGDPLAMREFRELFQENLDLILALDPSVCTLDDASSPTPTNNSTSGESSRVGSMTAFVILMLSFLLSW